MTDFLMPSLGADMDDGKLVEWLKKPGDTLKRGDVMAVVETQKGAIEIEVFVDGVLERTIAKPGETLPVGALLAVIRSAGEVIQRLRPRRPDSLLRPSRRRGFDGGPSRRSCTAFAGKRITPAARSEAGGGRSTWLGHPRARRCDRAAGTCTGQGGGRPRQGRQLRRDAQGHRGGHGAQQARNPALLCQLAMDLSVMADWLSEQNARRPVPKRLLPIVPILKACACALKKSRKSTANTSAGDSCHPAKSRWAWELP